MTLETFFEKFDQFADAPDAVAKLRELVLELAVQGKLVGQTSKDEPACKQLERIAAKKSKTGRVARVKAGSGGGSAPQDTETHVPSGWEKTSLAALVTVLNGRAYSKDELLDAGTPVLRVGNLFTSKHWYYSDLALEPDKYCDKGDLIFAWSASFGPFIWPGPKVIYHYHIWKLELHSEADLHKGFLYWFLQNKTQEIKRAGHGVSMLHMTKEKMEKLEVMLPPLAEQKRIVAKVDELMALCDRLEAQQQEREKQGSALARASLARFADAPTPANLNLLFHSSFSISPADLRKSILTLAPRGKLVEQRKAEVVADQDSGVSFPPEEQPYELPDSWVWKRLGDLVEFIGGSQPPKAKFIYEPRKGYTRFIQIRDFKSDANLTFIPTPLANRPFKEDDVMIGRYGPPVFQILRGLSGTYNVALMKAEPISKLISKDFLFYLLQEPRIQDRVVAESDRTAGQSGVRKPLLHSFIVAIPPLAEQRRIVAKVEQLMSLVDALEAQLAASRATAMKLLSALVSQLTTR